MSLSGRHLFRLIIYLGGLSLMVVIGLQVVEEKKSPVIVIPDEEVEIPPVSQWRLRPLELATLPIAVNFDWPVSSEVRSLTEVVSNDQDAAFRVDHEQAADVLTMSDGMVVYAGEGGLFGKTVSLAHRLQDDRVVQTVYGPLDRIDVIPGQILNRGDRLGLVAEPAEFRVSMIETDQIDTRDLENRRMDLIPFLKERGLWASEQLDEGIERTLQSPIDWPSPAALEDPPVMKFSAELDIKSAR